MTLKFSDGLLSYNDRRENSFMAALVTFLAQPLLLASVTCRSEKDSITPTADAGMASVRAPPLTSLVFASAFEQQIQDYR